MIRVLSVDDRLLLREGVAALIRSDEGMKLIGEACNGREALNLSRKHQPDITLMDVQMPEMNRIEAIGAIRGEIPEARIIVLTTHPGDFSRVAGSQSRSAGVPVEGNVTEGTVGYDSGGACREQTCVCGPASTACRVGRRTHILGIQTCSFGLGFPAIAGYPLTGNDKPGRRS